MANIVITGIVNFSRFQSKSILERILQGQMSKILSEFPEIREIFDTSDTRGIKFILSVNLSANGSSEQSIRISRYVNRDEQVNKTIFAFLLFCDEVFVKIAKSLTDES